MPRAVAWSSSAMVSRSPNRAAAATGAYWSVSSVFALADQGISSQSRQTQPVLNRSQKSASYSAFRKRSSRPVSNSGWLKNGRPVRV